MIYPKLDIHTFILLVIISENFKYSQKHLQNDHIGKWIFYTFLYIQEKYIVNSTISNSVLKKYELPVYDFMLFLFRYAVFRFIFALNIF